MVVEINKVDLAFVWLYVMLIARKHMVFPLIDDLMAFITPCFLIPIDASVKLYGVVYVDENTEVERRKN